MMHSHRNLKLEDDMLWNGSDRDGDVGRECEEHEDTDCEDGHSDTDW